MRGSAIVASRPRRQDCDPPSNRNHLEGQGSEVFSKGRLGAMLAMSVMMLIAAQPVVRGHGQVRRQAGLGHVPVQLLSGHLLRSRDRRRQRHVRLYVDPAELGFGGGSVTAPKTGKITKVKFVAGHSGSFKLVIARKNASGQFKVTAASAKISYGTDNCLVDCVTRTVTLSIALNVSTATTSAFRPRRSARFAATRAATRLPC